MKQRTPEQFLPLPTAWFHTLIALAESERHGYAILQDIITRTQGKSKVGPGTLYTALKRMASEGLIRECDGPDDPSGAGERRRYFRITPLGREVATAETERMTFLVRQARIFGHGGQKSTT